MSILWATPITIDFRSGQVYTVIKLINGQHGTFDLNCGYTSVINTIPFCKN